MGLVKKPEETQPEEEVQPEEHAEQGNLEQDQVVLQDLSEKKPKARSTSRKSKKAMKVMNVGKFMLRDTENDTGFPPGQVIELSPKDITDWVDYHLDKGLLVDRG